jgi:hypothetical protein
LRKAIDHGEHGEHGGKSFSTTAGAANVATGAGQPKAGRAKRDAATPRKGEKFFEAFPIQTPPVPFPRHSRERGNDGNSGASPSSLPQAGEERRATPAQGVPDSNDARPLPPSFPRTRESSAYTPARSAANQASPLREVLNEARAFRPLKSERSGRDARAPILDLHPFGPKTTNGIPASTGMTEKWNRHHKTDSGLKPRPSGRCEGWNPGLKAGVSTVATWEGCKPLPSSFTATGMNACRQLVAIFVAGRGSVFPDLGR